MYTFKLVFHDSMLLFHLIHIFHLLNNLVNSQYLSNSDKYKLINPLNKYTNLNIAILSLPYAIL